MSKNTQLHSTFPNQKQAPNTALCGPVCLANIYEHLGKSISVQDILTSLHQDEQNFTYTPQLARHLHENSVPVELISSNPHTLTLEWQNLTNQALIDKLKIWLALHQGHNWRIDALHLLFYLQEGGQLKIDSISTKMIDSYLDQNSLLIVGVNDSWIWKKRKMHGTTHFDDIHGEGEGHFVIVYAKENQSYLISDPYPTGLSKTDGLYSVDKDQLLVSILTHSPQILVVKQKYIL